MWCVPGFWGRWIQLNQSVLSKLSFLVQPQSNQRKFYSIIQQGKQSRFWWQLMQQPFTLFCWAARWAWRKSEELQSIWPQVHTNSGQQPLYKNPQQYTCCKNPPANRPTNWPAIGSTHQWGANPSNLHHRVSSPAQLAGLQFTAGEVLTRDTGRTWRQIRKNSDPLLHYYYALFKL